jgi:hypothetical protein
MRKVLRIHKFALALPEALRCAHVLSQWSQKRAAPLDTPRFALEIGSVVTGITADVCEDALFLGLVGLLSADGIKRASAVQARYWWASTVFDSAVSTLGFRDALNLKDERLTTKLLRLRMLLLCVRFYADLYQATVGLFGLSASKGAINLCGLASGLSSLSVTLIKNAEKKLKAQ